MNMKKLLIVACLLMSGSAHAQIFGGATAPGAAPTIMGPHVYVGTPPTTYGQLGPQTIPVVTLLQSAIPFFYPGSFTAGNNGAITGLPSNPNWSNAFICVQANKVTTVNVAGCYQFTPSSATAGTMSTNLYAGGTPYLQQFPSAITGTGAGAVTQATGSCIAGPYVTLPVSGLDPNGVLEMQGSASYPNSAGTKTVTLNFGGSQSALVVTGGNTASLVSATTTVFTPFQAFVASEGFPFGNQYRLVMYAGVPGTATATAPSYPSFVYTPTTATNIFFCMQLSATADTVNLEHYQVKLLPN